MSDHILRPLYDAPSGRAAKKVLTALDYHCKNFIEHSPFLVLSSFDNDGNVDASPRGGSKGFVKIIDDTTLVLPDAKGNNRVDSLSNIVETGRVGMLFFIPGIDETLRINGSGEVTTEVEYISLFPDERITPKSCLIIRVEEAFLHCAKALMRSGLWNTENHVARKDFPTMGHMLKDQLGGDAPVESHEDMVRRYQKDL